MKKTILVLLTITLLAGCKNYKIETEILNHQIDSLSTRLNETITNYQLSYRLTNEALDPNVIMLNKDLDTCFLGEIFSSNYRLFFHFTDFVCSPCLDTQLEVLQELENRYGPKYFCIIGNVQNLRTMGQLVHNFGFNCDIYIIPNEQSPFKDIQKFSESFYFKIDKNGVVNSIHFPAVSDSITTDTFLKSAARSFSQNE